MSSEYVHLRSSTQNMNQIIRTGFQPITHNIVFDPEKIENGKKLAKLNIRRVEELQGFGACKLIRCSCVRSMAFSEPPYSVQLEVSKITLLN